MLVLEFVDSSSAICVGVGVSVPGGMYRYGRNEMRNWRPLGLNLCNVIVDISDFQRYGYSNCLRLPKLSTLPEGRSERTAKARHYIVL